MSARFILFLFYAIVLGNSVGMASAVEKKMVLVAGAHMEGLSLNRSEIRQLFLGGNVTKDGARIVAVVNDSDPLLYEIFLQKIVFMSARTYERRLLSRVLHKGGQRLQYASDLASFENSLITSAGWVSFMWEQHARILPGVIVIEELWRGSAD